MRSTRSLVRGFRVRAPTSVSVVTRPPLRSRPFDKCTAYTYGPRFSVRRTQRVRHCQEGDPDEGDRAGSIRLGRRAGVPGHRGARGRRGRRARAGARGRLRPGRVAPDDRAAVHGAPDARVPQAEGRRAGPGRRRDASRRSARPSRASSPATRSWASPRARSPSSRSPQPRSSSRSPPTSPSSRPPRLPISGLTALQALRDVGKVQAGQRVLVIGAAGGVGSLAVQIAKAFGAEVTGVCSTSKVDLVRSIGADDVIDYTREDFADGSRHWDLIVDTAGRRSLVGLRRALTPKGTLVIVGGDGGGAGPAASSARSSGRPLLSLFVGQRLRRLVSKEKLEDLVTLTELDRGRHGHAGDRPDLPADRRAGRDPRRLEAGRARRPADRDHGALMRRAVPLLARTAGSRTNASRRTVLRCFSAALSGY